MPEDARRQDQDEASSWTHVQPRSRRRKPHQPEPLGQPENPPKPREDGLRSVDEISAEYRRTRQQFEESKSCSSLRELVRLNCSAVGAVSRAVCLGIGTFDPADGGWTAKRKAFVQLIAFLIMVEEIEKRWNIQISCIFQEPILTTSDTGFIASLGHTVVETPRGCELVDEHTLLFGVHLYHPIYALALKNGLPGIFVGTGWDMWDQVLMSTPHDLKNMELMERTYNKSSFPEDESTFAFSTTSIYWRRGAGKGESTGEGGKVAGPR